MRPPFSHVFHRLLSWQWRQPAPMHVAGAAGAHVQKGVREAQVAGARARLRVWRSAVAAQRSRCRAWSGVR